MGNIYRLMMDLQNHKMSEQSSIEVIGELSQNVIVHDMSFDWAGKRIAAACSDKSIKIYHKRSEGWAEQNIIKIQGASVWKVKWARPEFGIILATCSLDRNIRIYELKRMEKNENEKNEWVSINSIQENKSVQDIKFTPNKHLGLCLAIASSDGSLKVVIAEDPLKLRQWGAPYSIQVNDLGLNCLSWSKNQLKQDECLIVVGCKNIETTPKRVLNGMRTGTTEEPYKLEAANTIAFISFNQNSQTSPLQRIPVPSIRQSRAINDVSWALMNGRSYYLLAVASDSFLKIFEINVREKEMENGNMSVDVIRQIVLSDCPCYRVSWNVMGTYISGSEKKRIRIWRTFMRGLWNQVKEIEEAC